jgi:AcrR family transcriptional regulator
MTASRARAGRLRDVDANVKVVNATLELLDERTIAALRIDDITQVSGVAKTTIYWRWPSLSALVVAAMQAVLGPRPFRRPATSRPTCWPSSGWYTSRSRASRSPAHCR